MSRNQGKFKSRQYLKGLAFLRYESNRLQEARRLLDSLKECAGGDKLAQAISYIVEKVNNSSAGNIFAKSNDFCPSDTDLVEERSTRLGQTRLKESPKTMHARWCTKRSRCCHVLKLAIEKQMLRRRKRLKNDSDPKNYQ